MKINWEAAHPLYTYLYIYIFVQSTNRLRRPYKTCSPLLCCIAKSCCVLSWYRDVRPFSKNTGFRIWSGEPRVTGRTVVSQRSTVVWSFLSRPGTQWVSPEVISSGYPKSIYRGKDCWSCLKTVNCRWDWTIQTIDSINWMCTGNKIIRSPFFLFEFNICGWKVLLIYKIS